MRFPHFFVDRPIFATVISILIVMVGSVAYVGLPNSQYPDVAPPSVQVTASYPGASPERIARTVATPLEQEINGVDGMIYMESQSTADGSMTLTATFEVGTDVDIAQVLVQNRVAVAEPRLPDVVRRIGVTTRKQSPDLMMVIHLLSPDDTRDSLYVSNYAYLNIVDVLSRVKGVGQVRVFGAREYSMRVWLNPDRLKLLNLTTTDVVEALRGQNVQVAAGAIGQEPMPAERAFQLTVNARGRLRSPEEFGDVIVRSDGGGRLVRVRDIGRVELGARDYSINSYLNDKTAVAMVMFQQPGSNAVATAARLKEAIAELAEDFPPGIGYDIIYNPTDYVEESIDAVFQTLFEAGLLVVLTVFVFLQSWRTTIIPLVAIPVSLVGTFAVMELMGFSLNTLSLFGLVLAIGIVVDDAIVVVENVERLIDEGMEVKAATKRAMDEVGGALIATSLVLIAVFVPTSFLEGISGQFYRQFALTIAVSTAISTLVSLTLSPAMCGIFLRPKDATGGPMVRIGNLIFGWFFRLFNAGFSFGESAYAAAVKRVLRVTALVLIVYVGLLALTGWTFTAIPGGFIPDQDQGYLIIDVQTPPGSSLSRTDEVVQELIKVARGTPGIENAVSFVGFSGATFSNNSNAAAIFVTMTDSKVRASQGLPLPAVLGQLQGRLSQVMGARVLVIPPPPVRGIGTGGGFKMQIQSLQGENLKELEGLANQMAGKAMQNPGIFPAFTTFTASTPRLFADIDRTKAEMLEVPIPTVNSALQDNVGSLFVNDFNYLTRVYRVTVQADWNYRDEPSDILKLTTRSERGAVVELGSFMELRTTSGPDRVVRYNLFPAADVQGQTTQGFSSGEAIAEMERLAAETLPDGYAYEWTNLSYQQKKASGTAIYIFPLCVAFVFLVLAAQYESWLLPLAVILIVPMCILFGLTGLALRGMANDIIAQIGLVVLVGLACKNAILIVEFAREQENEGKDRFAAAVEACRLRLRPVLMTAFSFILGVVPLVIATGAASEMRQILGTTVFAGMLGVTLFGLLLTPVFYVVLRGLASDTRRGDVDKTMPTAEEEV